MRQKIRKISNTSALVPKELLPELREFIQSARQAVAQAVNAGLTLYWRVGEWIRKEILKEKLAQYGEVILQALSAKLVSEFGCEDKS